MHGLSPVIIHTWAYGYEGSFNEEITYNNFVCGYRIVNKHTYVYHAYRLNYGNKTKFFQAFHKQANKMTDSFIQFESHFFVNSVSGKLLIKFGPLMPYQLPVILFIIPSAIL